VDTVLIIQFTNSSAHDTCSFSNADVVISKQHNTNTVANYWCNVNILYTMLVLQNLLDYWLFIENCSTTTSWNCTEFVPRRNRSWLSLNTWEMVWFIIISRIADIFLHSLHSLLNTCYMEQIQWMAAVEFRSK